MKLKFGILCAASIAALGFAATTSAGAGQFDGVTINVMTFTGPQIAEPLQRHAPEFEKLTGAHVNVITVPFSDLYQKVLTDWSTGTNSVDAAVFAPQWMVDYVTPNLMEDLSDRIAKDKDLQEDDVASFFKDFSQRYQGKSYTVPLDGDFQMVYYRTDVAKQLGLGAPQTWDDYIAFAKAAQGKDFGTGKPGYGSCIAKKRNAQSYWMITSIAGAFLQSKGTAQGAFFDLDGFKPLTNNAGFAKALDVYKETTKYAPPDEINLDVGDTRNLFTAGQCALTLDWGDIGPLAVDKDHSKVMDKVGSVILPGSKQVLDRASGKLVDCNKDTCPYADANGINHAPFAAFGGWSGGINAKAKDKVKDAAYAFFSYMSQPAQSGHDVTIGITGFNPYRASHFSNLKPWLDSGMSEAAAKDYLGAIKASLDSPNMVLDLRIPNNQKYQQVVLDQTLARFLAGEIDSAATMKTITDGWNEITDEIGRDKQLAAYKSTIGAK